MQITHCPQCATAFTVSPEQLQQAQGWVRCGHCQTVFQAHLHWGMPVPAPSVEPSIQKPLPIVARFARPWAWTVLTGVAVLCLLLQAVMWQRHGLAAEAPALRGVLSSLCAPLGCAVHWPREPDALVIESSSFSQHASGGYEVQLNLKNSQRHPVATPALELTLTDLNDDVVVRRVFSVEEQALPDHIAALGDLHSTLRFDLDNRVDQRVTGFRALIFYP